MNLGATISGVVETVFFPGNKTSSLCYEFQLMAEVHMNTKQNAI